MEGHGWDSPVWMGWCSTKTPFNSCGEIKDSEFLVYKHASCLDLDYGFIRKGSITSQALQRFHSRESIRKSQSKKTAVLIIPSLSSACTKLMTSSSDGPVLTAFVTPATPLPWSPGSTGGVALSFWDVVFSFVDSQVRPFSKCTVPARLCLASVSYSCCLIMVLVGALRTCFDSGSHLIHKSLMLCFTQINSTKFNWSKEFSF